MWIRKRISRRRGFLKKYRALVLFLAGMGGCLFAFVVTQQIRGPIEIEQLGPNTRFPELQLDPQFHPAQNERPVYPYSVIQGGVLSREELLEQISNDQVVAGHYARFETDRARIVRAEETRFMHVAYRLRNRVYWTVKKIKIPKGETLITDGKDFARTRCGNRVSVEPMEPVEEKEEPAIETFDTPTLVRLEEPDLPGFAEHGIEFRNLPPIQRYAKAQRTKIRPYYYYRPLFTIRPSEFVVPEPATLSLLAVGLVAFITFKIARKK
jgi:hypothetical protein